MINFLKRTWAEIDLDAFSHNYNQIKKHINKNTKIMCVVKADAYGHGANRLSAELESLGAYFLAVSNLEEAMQIRAYGVKLPILILGYTPVSMVATLAKHNISQTIISEKYAFDLSNYAKTLNICIKVHIKIDTGMGRLGLVCQNTESLVQTASSIKNICNLSNITVEGMFTHFSVADETSPESISYTKKQYATFLALTTKIRLLGVNIPLIHCSNSSAIMNYPDANLSMVRPGIILYGLYPSDSLKNNLELKPVMQLKSVISLIKVVSPGTSLSYGRDFVTKKHTKIATVPVGYADGFPRCMYPNAYMLVRHQKANIIGRICMDQLMLDVTDIPDVREGDIVTIFGNDGSSYISVDQLAKISGFINYELVCLIGKRVPRVYYKDGKIIDKLDYIYP